MVDAADLISKAVREQLKLSHPEEEDLSFLYGTIITDGNDEFNDKPTANLCIFADRQVSMYSRIVAFLEGRVLNSDRHLGARGAMAPNILEDNSLLF